MHVLQQDLRRMLLLWDSHQNEHLITTDARYIDFVAVSPLGILIVI